MVRHLVELSPAEALFFLEGKRSSPYQMMKYTLADLIIREVLLLSRQKAETKNGTVTLSYVQKGPQAAGFVPKPHEEIFYKLFAKANDIRIPLTRLAAVGRSSKYYFDYLVRKNATIKPHIRNQFFSYKLRDSAEKIKAEIQAEIEELSTHPAQLQQILPQLKGNILLISNANPEILAELDAVWRSRNGLEEVDFDIDFEIFEQDFDSGYESVSDSGGDSGCGSDSGGDSGCGSDSGGDSGCGSGCGGGCGGD